MEIQHFIHKHPLILSENKNVAGGEIVCNGCLQNISGTAYSCRNCLFNLHKLCAELPTEMKHPMHPQHPLTLFQRVTNRSSVISLCDVCEEQLYGGFTYRCSPCDFDVDIRCVVRAQSVEHKSHKHPLSPLLSSALFECHACGTEHKGISYMCNICRFWIHNDCASLPTTFNHSSHIHPLTLSYSYPYQFHQFTYHCGICGKELRRGFWIYHCAGCRYFVHVKCSTTKTMYHFRESKPVIKAENRDETTLMHLPVPNELIDPVGLFVKQISQGELRSSELQQFRHESVCLIDPFVKQISLEENKTEPGLNHFSHNHPLTLFDPHSADDLCYGSKMSILNEHNNEKICDACVRPIFAPFYSCSLCNFFLHKWCAELPNELQHPCHPHPLILLGKCPDFNGFFGCHGCLKYCNGFTFQCAECKDYYLDVKCASLPSSIVHEVHKHPLVLKRDCIAEGCVACERIDPMYSFGCRTCKVNLHYECAQLPRTISHRYDEHPFTLTYAPIKDGSNEYYCEFCEEEIDPFWWFYHCIDCDKSACAKCIYKVENEYRNMKLGITYNFDGHPHPLTLVQSKNKSTICNRCGEYTQNYVHSGIFLKCTECNIVLHLECARMASSLSDKSG